MDGAASGMDAGEGAPRGVGADGGVPLPGDVGRNRPDRRTAEAEQLDWEVLDREVARLGKPVTILLGNHFHQRSAPRVLERYRERPGAEAWAPEKTRRLLTCDVTRTFSPPEMLSGALQAHSIAGLECPGETVFFVPQHRALVCADALIGAGNGLIRVPPIRWAENTPQGQELYRKEFRASLGKLKSLEIDMVLVSHGEPVLTDGSAALAEALAAPAWGEN